MPRDTGWGGAVTPTPRNSRQSNGHSRDSGKTDPFQLWTTVTPTRMFPRLSACALRANALFVGAEFSKCCVFQCFANPDAHEQTQNARMRMHEWMRVREGIKKHQDAWNAQVRMTMHEKVRECMLMHETIWKSMRIHEDARECVRIMRVQDNAYECLRMIWVYMRAHKITWECIRMHDNEWEYMKINNNA